MRQNSECPFEQQIRKALGAGGLTEEQEQHVDGCAQCSETLFLLSGLKSLNVAPETSAQELEIQRILLRARLQKEAKGAFKLRLLFNGLTFLIVLLGLGAAAILDWSKVVSLLAGGSPLAIFIAAIVLILLIAQELEIGDIA